MIKKYLLRTLAALALAFVIIISTSSHAQAAAPNSLMVFTGFQPYGGAVTPAVGVGGVATVVDKTTSNGLTIPLSSKPYYGNHFDTNNNGRTDANSILWGTDGSLFGYSFQLWKYLIWCGNSGGVPDGEMQVDVTLAFQNDGYASATQLNVGGVIKKGHWAGEWWRQGEDGEDWVGFKTSFTGQNARIVALNPGLMVVIFTFIEDAPSYSGTIQTNKRLASNSAVLSTASAPGNSKIELKSPYSTSPFDSNSSANPWSRSNVYVTWDNQFANTPGRYYKNIITLPSGWRINRVQTSLPGNDGLTCTEANQSGICTVSGLTVYNGSVTYVDWFIEAIPSEPPITANYPWLQTTQGNVVANGKITGHPASDTNPGARLTTNTDKEVEFLIISKLGGDGPFCSSKNYILTNSEATGGTNCSNGSGYSVLNVYSLVDGGTDKVVAGVKAAYDKLGNTCRGETALNSDFATNSAPIYTLLNKSADVCPDGVIIKYSGTSLAGYSLTKGRVTILVDGDLTIGQNIGYGTTGYSDPRDVPNLAIVVKGNVKILAATPQVDASIYATGTISTCDTAPAKFCGYQLTINGFLSAQSGFIFGRAYILGYNGQAVPPHAPAEIVNLTLQSVLYPPPGIDYGSVFKGDSSVKIDSSEYQPRF